MKNLTCDVCGTDKVVNTYKLVSGVFIFMTDFLPFPIYSSSSSPPKRPIEVEVCDPCFYQVEERYKKFLVENNLVKK